MFDTLEGQADRLAAKLGAKSYCVVYVYTGSQWSKFAKHYFTDEKVCDLLSQVGYWSRDLQNFTEISRPCCSKNNTNINSNGTDKTKLSITKLLPLKV